MAKSLSGKLIVITRSSREWESALVRHGANVYVLPCIAIKPVALTTDSKNTLRHIDTYDWVIFTSAAGVRYTKALLRQLQVPTKVKVAVVGKKTAQAATAAGFTVVFRPSVASSATLGSELHPAQGKKILLLRTTIASSELPKQLAARGASVTALPVYETTPVTAPDKEFTNLLQSGRVDCITFASPSAVGGFCQRVTGGDLAKAKLLPVVAIGPSAEAALVRAGFCNVHIATEPTINGMVAVLRRELL